MIAILYILSIFFGAAGDGLKDGNHKLLGHVLRALEPFSLVLALIWYTEGFGWLIAAYICLRIALFDFVYNLIRGLPFFYHGTTSYWDRFMVKCPPFMEAFAKVIFLAGGVLMIVQNVL